MGNTTSFPHDEREFAKVSTPSARAEGLLFNNKYPDIALKEISTQIDMTQLGEKGFEYLRKKIDMLPSQIYAAKLTKFAAVKGSESKRNLQAYFEMGTYSLADLLASKKVALPNEDLFWYVLEFLLDTGRTLESQLEYHPDISLDTVFLTQSGQLKMTNPYMNMKYAKNMVEERLPILAECLESSAHAASVSNHLDKIKTEINNAQNGQISQKYANNPRALQELNTLLGRANSQVSRSLKLSFITAMNASLGDTSPITDKRGKIDQERASRNMAIFEKQMSPQATQYAKYLVEHPLDKQPQFLFSQLKQAPKRTGGHINISQVDLHTNMLQNYRINLSNTEPLFSNTDADVPFGFVSSNQSKKTNPLEPFKIHDVPGYSKYPLVGEPSTFGHVSHAYRTYGGYTSPSPSRPGSIPPANPQLDSVATKIKPQPQQPSTYSYTHTLQSRYLDPYTEDPFELGQRYRAGGQETQAEVLSIKRDPVSIVDSSPAYLGREDLKREFNQRLDIRVGERGKSREGYGGEGWQRGSAKFGGDYQGYQYEGGQYQGKYEGQGGIYGHGQGERGGLGGGAVEVVGGQTGSLSKIVGVDRINKIQPAGKTNSTVYEEAQRLSEAHNRQGPNPEISRLAEKTATATGTHRAHNPSDEASPSRQQMERIVSRINARTKSPKHRLANRDYLEALMLNQQRHKEIYKLTTADMMLGNDKVYHANNKAKLA